MHRLPRLLPLTLSAAVAVGGLSGCASDEGSAGSDSLRVVTSIYPLQFLTERIGGEHVAASVLSSAGGAHDFELTIAQTAEIADADVAVYLAGFESAIDEAIDQNGPERVLDVAAAADLRGADESHEEHAEHGDDAEHSDEAEDDHDHGTEDPHFWLDPERMSAVAAAITDELADAAPEKADDFTANLQELQNELGRLDNAYEKGLARCDLSTVVVSHDAFGYLERYGLEFAPIAGLSPEAEPSLQHIAELQELIREDGVTTVFSETLASPAMAETLADDLGLDTAVLDPIEGLSDETADEDYLSLMEQNLTALQTANRCR